MASFSIDVFLSQATVSDIFAPNEFLIQANLVSGCSLLVDGFLRRRLREPLPDVCLRDVWFGVVIRWRVWVVRTLSINQSSPRSSTMLALGK